MDIGRIDHETTSNVGVVQGGVATNIVPEVCTVKCEVRSLSPDKLIAQAEKMITAARNSAARFGTKLDLQMTDCYSAFTIPNRIL